jgi:hypothetical protein
LQLGDLVSQPCNFSLVAGVHGGSSILTLRRFLPEN